MKNKFYSLIALLIIALSMVGCGNPGDIKPFESKGDNATVTEIVDEMTTNTVNIAKGGVFNQVWATASN